MRGRHGSIDAVVAPLTSRGAVPNRVVTGLLSGASADGSGAVGSDGVSALSLSQIDIAMTFAPPDVLPAGLPGKQSGKLLRGPAYRAPGIFANITAYEQAHDPDAQGFDSNPYATLALADHTLVADAAANDILSVSPTGQVSLFAVLPNINGTCKGQPNDAGTTGCDFVPTSLAAGPDGSIYVGGFGAEFTGAGRVFRLDAVTGAVLQQWGDLTAVSGVGVGADGSVFASQLSFNPNKGKVTRIMPSGHRSSVSVPFPGGLVVTPNGGVLVSAFSIAPATGLGVPGIDSSGQVWKLPVAAFAPASSSTAVDPT